MSSDAIAKLQQLLLAGRFDQVIQQGSQLKLVMPNSVGLRFLLGQASLGLGKIEDALGHFDQAIRLAGGRPEPWLAAGENLVRHGYLQEASSLLQQGVTRFPRVPQMALMLAELSVRLGESARAWQAIQPLLDGRLDLEPAVGNRLALVLRALSRVDEAVGVMRKLVARHPLPELMNNLGSILLDQWRLEEARDQFTRAISLDASMAPAYANLGNTLMRMALKDRTLLAEAMQVLDRAIELDGQDCRSREFRVQAARMTCLWDDLERHEEALLACIHQASAARLVQLDPFPLLALDDVTPQDIFHLGEAFAAQFPRGRFHERFGAVAAHEDGRIRLAYFSADFLDHPTTHLIREVIELHDRERFEVIGIDLGPEDGSEARKGILSLFDRILRVPIDMAATAAAREIAEMGIDVLVDLNGYTRMARPDILALRPARVQAQYLGFPASTGAGFIDYIIADKVVLPPEDACHYREMPAYLPHSYQCNDRRRLHEITSTRAENGLPEHAFVYSCFNAAYKLTPSVFARWCRILKAVEGSVLWLLDEGEMMQQNLRDHARHHGLDPERLIFAPKRPHDEHLGRIGLADLVLDTLPYNAHTTASDALWAGVPVLTLMGKTFASRVAASLLKAVGMEHLIAPSEEGYERIAIELGRHPERVEGLKKELAAARSSAALFDTPSLTAALEALVSEMHATALRGDAPKVIYAEPYAE